MLAEKPLFKEITFEWMQILIEHHFPEHKYDVKSRQAVKPPQQQVTLQQSFGLKNNPKFAKKTQPSGMDTPQPPSTMFTPQPPETMMTPQPPETVMTPQPLMITPKPQPLSFSITPGKFMIH